MISLDSVGERTDLAPGILQITGSIGTGNNPLTKRFEIPALLRGDGRGGFADVASEQNLAYPAAPMGANFGDLNGDGFLDFYLATGDVPYWALRPNVMFLNQGGSRFANITMGGGFGHLQKGHGVSFADIDNDGDQDVYVQMGGQLTGDKYNDALFENPGFGHHWITLKGRLRRLLRQNWVRMCIFYSNLLYSFAVFPAARSPGSRKKGSDECDSLSGGLSGAAAPGPLSKPST